MALDTTTLKTNLLSAFQQGQGGGSQDAVAQAIADAIDSYVKGADVSTTVTGTDSTGGPITGTGTGGVS